VHVDRPVHLAVVDGRAVVHKEYVVADPAPVHEAMVALWASPFGGHRRPPGMPEPIGFDGRTITMAFVDGDPIGRRGDLGSTVSLAVPCAQLLADLHACGVTVPRRRDAVRLAASIDRKTARFVAMHPGVAARWHDAVGALVARAAAFDAGELVVGHGDFSPRNVLDAVDGPVLIDFDRLQLAHPSRDVEYWRAWAWVTELLGGASPTWSCTDAFVEAYVAGGPLRLGVAVTDRHAVALHRGAALLRIAEGWSALRDAPAVAARVVDEACAVLSLRIG
jgi:aminoglycoside phosphotransferase (APT) family kinase protein